ncbi:MAG TPA: hypothetical protein DD490_27440 [Acidobacteria bacterium]|nr:hypothetical protein [Acidobacteriota bacterium]
MLIPPKKKVSPLERVYTEALACEERGELAEAERLYKEAIQMAPRWAVAPFNLGLLYKRQRRWRESLEYNRRATKLDATDEAAWWNLGIAATAVGDWSTARAAWRGYGIPIPAGEGPIELPLGPIPIRLDPDGASEVVWCRRLDPARAVIENVPLPASGRRFGDVLLTDGEPRGTRRVQGREVPVFNEIEVLETSLYKTWSAVAEAEDAAGIEALQDLATERGLAAEDWSALRVLCRACSEGRPHAHNRDPGSENESGEADGERTVGLAAATAEEARDLLNAWSAAAPGRTWSDLRIELD